MKFLLSLLLMIPILTVCVTAKPKSSFALEEQPKDLLIYYGWLNSYNYSDNSWNNQLVAEDFARYDLLVFGDGIQNSGHGDYANTEIIIPRIKELNGNVQICGYVTVNQTYANFTDKVDDWITLGVDCIFMDEAGYDYGTVATNGRSAFNDKVDYIHGEGLFAFANAWKIQHVLGIENDPSYPNSTWNSPAKASKLNSSDWFLMESFAIDSSNAYESKTQWASRGNEAKEYQVTYGINLAGVSVIPDSDGNGLDEFKFVYVSACMWNLDAVGTSDSYYGASSAKSKMWTRPTMGIGSCEAADPVVEQSSYDTDVYFRYLDYGYLKIDFSSGSELSAITKY